MKNLGTLIAAIALTATVASTASAGITSTTTFRDTLDTPFFPGTGNSNQDFAITRSTESAGLFAGNTVELGLKAKRRFFGQTGVGGSGGLYIVQPGFSPTSGAAGAPDDPTRAWWNFDFSVDYGDLRDNTNTMVTLTIADIEGDILPIPFVPSATFPVGAQLAQDSWNTGFGFLSAPLGGFDPSVAGDYTLTFAAVGVGNGEDLGSVSITVRVIPTPGAVALAGLGGLAATRRRRA